MNEIFEGYSFDTPEARERFYTMHTCHPTTTEVAAGLPRVQWLADEHKKHPFQRVLDIGCHDGFSTRWLLDDPRIHKVVGIDLCHDAIAWARHLAEVTALTARSEYRQQAFADLPTDELYDVIVAFELIEHLEEEDARALLRCMDDRLYPTGRAFITTPEKNGPWGISNPDPSHIFLLDHKNLETLLREEIGPHALVKNVGNFLIAGWIKR